MIALPWTIMAVGRLKSGPEFDLVELYRRRLKTLDILEMKPSSKEKEAEDFLKLLHESDFITALDEKGAHLTSQEFAASQQRASQSFKRLVFLIGGADGLSKMILNRAHLVLSFGKLTWPHMLVRAMLCEQLYRVHSLLNNHPYHREG